VSRMKEFLAKVYEVIKASPRICVAEIIEKTYGVRSWRQVEYERRVLVYDAINRLVEDGDVVRDTSDPSRTYYSAVPADAPREDECTLRYPSGVGL
jgi:hypothetical protein